MKQLFLGMKGAYTQELSKVVIACLSLYHIHQILSDTMDPGGTPELPPLLGPIGHSRVLGVLDSFLFGSMAAEGFPDSGELLCIYMQESIFIFLC